MAGWGGKDNGYEISCLFVGVKMGSDDVWRPVVIARAGKPCFRDNKIHSGHTMSML